MCMNLMICLILPYNAKFSSSRPVFVEIVEKSRSFAEFCRVQRKREAVCILSFQWTMYEFEDKAELVNIYKISLFG